MKGERGRYLAYLLGSPIFADILDENAYPRLGCGAGTARHGTAVLLRYTRLSRLPVAVKVCLGVELYPRDQTQTIDGEKKKKKEKVALP